MGLDVASIRTPSWISWTLCHPVSLNRQVNPIPSLAFIIQKNVAVEDPSWMELLKCACVQAHAHALSISASFIHVKLGPIYIYIRPGEFFVFFVRDANKIGLDRPSRPTVLVGQFFVR